MEYREGSYDSLFTSDFRPLLLLGVLLDYETEWEIRSCLPGDLSIDSESSLLADFSIDSDLSTSSRGS